MFSCMKISYACCQRLGQQILNLYKKSTKWPKKNSFSLQPFRNGLCSLETFCIIWTLPNIDACITYPWIFLKLIALFNTFFFIPLKWKLWLRDGFKLFKRTQKDIYIVSNLFLDSFIRLRWHHYNYNHTPIHYNHEIVNTIKI
jgi:hypothetical protein